MENLLSKLQKLNDASIEMHKVLDPARIYEVILDQVKTIFNLQNSAILLYEKDGETLTIRAARGYDPETVRSFRGRKGVGITGMVLEKNEPVLVADVKSHERYVEGVHGAASELAAPLVVNGKLIGVLDIESTEKGEFDEVDLHLFTTFAAQAAAAIKSALFHREIEEKAGRLEILHRISRTLATEHNFEIIVDRILACAKEALDFSRCALLLIDGAEPGVLRIRASVGYGDVRGMRIKIGEGITGKAAQTGKPMLVPDVTEHPEYIPGVSGGRCEICAPLLIEGKLVGVLDAESKEVNAYNEHDLELLSIFAAHAAGAIHNSRLITELEKANRTLKANLKEMERLNRELDAYSKQIAATNEALEKQVRQLTTLHQAGLTITSSLDLDTTLERIVDMIRDLVQTSATTVKLIDGETKEMKVRMRYGDESGTEAPSKYDLPLVIGRETIGVFELASGRQLDEEEKRLLETLATQAAIAIENARLFEETQETYYETLRSLAKALEARDSYTRGHSERVASLALKIAERMGVEEEERKEIYSVALLHDIGKIGVRDDILLKTDALSAEEWKVIQNHPVFGDAILAPLRFLTRVAGMVKYHHERWDGSGYPEGLKAENIPLPSRIVAAADAFDAITSDRPYRPRKTREEAIEILKAESGRQFDPKVVEAILTCFEESD
jgi:HD-GYP domain-containing protein (c-di-GMP phosphodiesterase class II)